MESAAERLAAAKAAVAALSGKPVAETEAVTSPASDPEEEAPAPACPDPAPALEAEPPTASPVIVPVQAPAPAIEPAVPDWFKKGQEQAKKPKVEKPVQRSRYAAALERAEEEITAREESQKSATEELSARMRGMRASVQAASAAAGAQPTGVIADLPPLEESPAAVAAPSVEPQVAPVAPVLADTPIPATEEAPVPPAVAAAVPEEVLTPSPADIPSPLDRSAAVDLSQVPAVAADDPDVVLREGQRPLTGATVAAPPVGASPLAGIPTPADQAAEGSRRLVIPSVGEIPPVVEGASDSSPRKRRAISLPNIGISQELPRISMDDHLQAAPLAEERPAHDGRVRDLSAIVPSVASPATPPAAPHSAALRDALPSLSQVPAAADPGLSGSINLAGSFSAMGATGAAAPLTDDMFEAASEDDLYIEDVDDSAYMEQVTETGAMAGPGYVEMPKSRFGRIFGKRRRHAQVEASTPQEWLDVEDTFDAREAGAARGGWESFREEDEFDGYDEDFDPRQTTAFSPDFGENQSNAAAPLHRRGRHFEGGAFSRGTADGEEPFDEEESRPRREAVSSFADGLPAGFVFDDAPEAAAIEQFHSKRIDMEVWFVALGSELAGNGGMRAFMETHEAELKGSIIIELEALGAGELTLMDREGTYLPKKASSRMKRLVRKAGQAVGLSVGDGTMEWRDSASAYAMKHGQQAMHLAGMEGKKPTFFGEADDVLENVDGDQLALNSDFVMELLKQI